jgi:hypothetical protein
MEQPELWTTKDLFCINCLHKALKWQHETHHFAEWFLISQTIYAQIGFEGQNWVLSKEVRVQTNEQQRHFNQRPVSELYGEVDSIQASLNLRFNLQQ